MSRRKPLELRQSTDTTPMRVAIDWCIANGYPVRRCTPWQLRVGPINFWPNRGTINFDATHATEAEGLIPFRRMVTVWYSYSELEQEQAMELLAELGLNALEKHLLKGYL